VSWSTIYSNKATAQQQYESQRHFLWQFTVKVTESKSEIHWHKQHPNVCTEVTLYKQHNLITIRLLLIVVGQHWTISDTNSNVWSWFKKSTSLKNSTALILKLNTSSIQYFLRCQWLLSLSRYSQTFMELVGVYSNLPPFPALFSYDARQVCYKSLPQRTK
jgi:hypothetical protein